MPLNPGPLSVNSDFFPVGGSSILRVKLQGMLQRTFPSAPMLMTLMRASTLGAMTAAIKKGQSSESIDWEEETKLPELLEGMVMKPRERSAKTDGLTVLVTGATGYLGRHHIRSLRADNMVTRVIALVRNVENVEVCAKEGDKISIITGDVSAFNLGLSNDVFSDLSEASDVLVHCEQFSRYCPSRGYCELNSSVYHFK